MSAIKDSISEAVDRLGDRCRELLRLQRQGDEFADAWFVVDDERVGWVCILAHCRRMLLASACGGQRFPGSLGHVDPIEQLQRRRGYRA